MDIGLTRLANQRIIDRPFTQPADVVAWLGAMQAQDYLGALWAIGLRMAKAPQPPTEQLVEQAIADRTIIRTWPMRGTLHFVAAADVRWLLQLLTPRQIKQSAGRYRQLALDDRNAVLDPVHANRICPGGNGIFSPTVVIDGKIRGTWQRSFKRGGVTVEWSPFETFTPVEEAALAVATAEYGKFLGMTVSAFDPLRKVIIVDARLLPVEQVTRVKRVAPCVAIAVGDLVAQE